MNCCILCPDPCSCIPYIQQIPGIIFELATIWNVWGRGTILLCESSMDEVFCAYFIEFVVTVAKGFFFAYWLAPVRQSLCVGRWWWPEYWKPPRVSNHFLNMFSIFIALEFEFQLSTEHIFEICAIYGIMRKTDCNWIALGGLKWNRSLHSGYFVTQNSLGRICLGT